jgi:hypothetical protein
MKAKIYNFEYFYKKKKADDIAQSIVDTFNNSEPCDIIKIKKFFKEWLDVTMYLVDKRNIA